MKKIYIEKYNQRFKVKVSKEEKTKLNSLADFFENGRARNFVNWDMDWIDWIYSNTNNGWLSGDKVDIFIDNNDIEISNNRFEYPPPFIVSKERFLELVEVWKKIIQLKPEIIELTQDDEDRITFEYDTPEGHQKIIVE